MNTTTKTEIAYCNSHLIGMGINTIKVHKLHQKYICINSEVVNR